MPASTQLRSKNRKTTIYDLARISGTSPSTVSAVMNGSWRERRIRESTALNIKQVAAKHGYTPNLQARGLRKARSGMVGMIIPVHDNRFFASLGQSFENHARERDLCPVIASTLRDPVEEIRIVKTLISYAVEFLFIAGATNPDALSELCGAANLPHVFVDLPGKHAPSVTTNNYLGAELLTRKISAPNKARKNSSIKTKTYFLGGNASDHATAQRIAAFTAVISENGDKFEADQIISCGYSPDKAATAIKILCDRIGSLPSGLLLNSLTVFEGVMSHFVHLPAEAFEHSTIGCYDYDPFATFLKFPVHMVRQNSDEMIARAYELIERKVTDPLVIEVQAELIPPRTIHKGRYRELG
ncbi:MAG: LacI family DNA-binding transcriptional regulator [Granulosicoccus sp.]